MTKVGTKAIRFALTVLFVTAPMIAWAATGAPLSDQALWLQECGACHDAFPPALLPGYSWKKIMSSLDKHFGDDASLDPQAQKRILNVLLGGRPADIPTRITDQNWFLNIHGGNLAQYAQEKGFRLVQCNKCHRF